MLIGTEIFSILTTGGEKMELEVSNLISKNMTKSGRWPMRGQYHHGLTNERTENIMGSYCKIKISTFPMAQLRETLVLWRTWYCVFLDIKLET